MLPPITDLDDDPLGGLTNPLSPTTPNDEAQTMATGILYTPSQQFPANAIFSATQDGTSVIIINPTTRRMFWSIEAGTPTGDIATNASIEAGRSQTITMNSGEQLRTAVPGLQSGSFQNLKIVVG